MTWLIVRQQLLNPFLVGVAGVQKHLTFLTPRLKWMETNVAAVVLYSGEGVCFLSRQEVQKKKKKACEAFCSGYTHTHTQIHTHTVGDKEIEWSALYPEEAIVSSIEHQSIHSGPQGRRVGMWEEACGNRQRGRETSWLDRSIRWKIVSIWSISPLYLPSFFSSILSLILSSLPLLEFSSPFPPQNSLPSSCSCFAQLIWRLTIFPWPVLFSITLCRIFFFLFVCFSIIVPFCYCLLVEHFCLQSWMVHCAHLSLLAVTAFVLSLSHIMSLSSRSITFCSPLLFIAFSCWNVLAFHSSTHPLSSTSLCIIHTDSYIHFQILVSARLL